MIALAAVVTTIGVLGIGWIARGFWDAWRRASEVIEQTRRETQEDQAISAVRREPPPGGGHIFTPGPLPPSRPVPPPAPPAAKRPLPCGHPSEVAFAVRKYACGTTTTHRRDGSVTHTHLCTMPADLDRELRDLT